MLARFRMDRLALVVFACALCPQSAFAQAKATIQLPTAKVISVQTTVTVPDSGSGFLGGLNSGSSSRGPGMARGEARDGMGANVRAVVIDFDSMEEMTNWTVAKNHWETGKVADAVTRFQEMADKGGTKDLKDAATEVIEYIRQEGLVKYQKAMALANDDPITAAERVDNVLEQYGCLILNSKRRADQLALQRSPVVAESRHGKTANEYLEKGRLAEEKGKLGVAAIYYRMASKLVGTKAGEEGALELARIEKAKSVIAKVSPRLNDRTKPAPPPPEPPLTETATKLLELARQYRKADPDKSREYYRKALLEIPTDTDHFTRVSAESRSLDMEAQKAKASKKRK